MQRQRGLNCEIRKVGGVYPIPEAASTRTTHEPNSKQVEAVSKGNVFKHVLFVPTAIWDEVASSLAEKPFNGVLRRCEDALLVLHRGCRMIQHLRHGLASGNSTRQAVDEFGGVRA